MPAKNEMITILHFHLQSNIIVRTNKTKDVQFFVEVMSTGKEKPAYAQYQFLEGQRERGRKYNINTKFENFVNQVRELQQFKELNVTFEQPLREHGFYGVAYNNSY